MRSAAVAAALAALVLVGASGAATRPGVPRFRHVIVIVFENHEYGEVLGSGQAPEFDALARRYAVLTQSYALTHPSLPNYLALVSGSTQGITDDCTDCFLPGRNLADTIEGAWKTWKVYAEGLPHAGYDRPFADAGYAMKHVPFMYFQNVRSSARRRARVVPFGAFARDLGAGKLPTFSMVVPNLCHTMHDCSVATGDAWLKSFITPLLTSPAMKNSVVLVTFDEGDTNAGGGGHIPTLVLGPLVRPGARLTRRVNTYGLLRMIEDGLGLPLLGKSAGEHPLTGLWR